MRGSINPPSNNSHLEHDNSKGFNNNGTLP